MNKKNYLFLIYILAFTQFHCAEGIFDPFKQKPKDGTWENDKVKFIVESNGSEITYLHLKQTLLPEPYGTNGLMVKIIRPKNAGFPIEEGDVDEKYEEYIGFSEIELHIHCQTGNFSLVCTFIIKFKSSDKSKCEYDDLYSTEDSFTVKWVSSSVSE